MNCELATVSLQIGILSVPDGAVTIGITAPLPFRTMRQPAGCGTLKSSLDEHRAKNPGAGLQLGETNGAPHTQVDNLHQYGGDFP